MSARIWTIRSFIFQTLDEHFSKGAKEFPDFISMLRLVRENFPTSKFNVQAWATYRARYKKETKKGSV